MGEGEGEVGCDGGFVYVVFGGGDGDDVGDGGDGVFGWEVVLEVGDGVFLGEVLGVC